MCLKLLLRRCVPYDDMKVARLFIVDFCFFGSLIIEFLFI